jgi:enamine deaminase RidA (YjgF/YER057c/UK114 family)
MTTLTPQNLEEARQEAQKRFRATLEQAGCTHEAISNTITSKLSSTNDFACLKAAEMASRLLDLVPDVKAQASLRVVHETDLTPEMEAIVARIREEMVSQVSGEVIDTPMGMIACEK